MFIASNGALALVYPNTQPLRSRVTFRSTVSTALIIIFDVSFTVSVEASARASTSSCCVATSLTVPVPAYAVNGTRLTKTAKARRMLKIRFFISIPPSMTVFLPWDLQG